jgi:hypothetical protein
MKTLFTKTLTFFKAIFENIKLKIAKIPIDTNMLSRYKILRLKKRYLFALTLLLFFLGGAYYYYGIYEQQPTVIYAKKLTTLTDQVSKLTLLPTNEKPIVATVTNIAVLPKESFFAKAQNGDKILMYKQNKKAILYRPSTGTVIAVAVLDFQNTTPTPNPQQPAVAGASTSAQPTTSIIIPITPLMPQGKVLIRPPGQ